MLGRLETTTEVADLADCDLVIEAIVEELGAKRELFAELDRITRPEAILASNTSALSVTDIAEATERPERVIGMHFFNPAPLLPLVEIVRTEKSADEAVDAAYEWAESAGKEPVRCNDTPGFIVNRILIPLLNDCVRVLDEAGVSARGPRQGADERCGLAHGAVRARRPGRHRHPHPRLGSAARRAGRGADGTAGAPARHGRTGRPRPQKRPRLLQLRVAASKQSRHHKIARERGHVRCLAPDMFLGA